MQRRAFLALLVAGPATVAAGCGAGNAPAPPDGSNLPDEVRADQERMEAAAKKAADREAAQKKH